MPEYTWYSNVRRYRAANGHFVSEERIKDHIDSLVVSLSQRFAFRTQLLVDEYSDDMFFSWVGESRQEIIDLHNCVAIIALGGRQAAQQFSSEAGSVWQAVAAYVAMQLGYFDRFMFGIVGGTIAVDNSIIARAAMYPLAGYGTYENAVRVREITAAGFREERRMIGSGNPCEGCLIEAARGWQPIGTLRHIGDSPCRSRCRCYFTYRSAPDVDE